MLKCKLIIIMLVILIITGCSTKIDSSSVSGSSNKELMENNRNNQEADVKESFDEVDKTQDVERDQQEELQIKQEAQELNQESNQIASCNIYLGNTDEGEETLNVEGMEIGDYLIDNNIAYLMLVDDFESPRKIELVKYHLADKKTTLLLRKEYETFINVYSFFIKKLDNDFISLDLRNEIYVIDVKANIVRDDIIIPDNRLYPDISYSGEKICYYKDGNLYISSIDFSNEKLLKADVEDTEDSVQPLWSHDDSKIAYFNGYNIEVINLQGEVLESLPRHARYMKWSFDDSSLLIGYLGAYSKINMKEKVIITTSAGYEYSEHGYDTLYIDVTSPEVVFESNTGVLVYKYYNNNVECYNFTNQLRLNTFEESIKNIRWSNKENELAINYFNEDSGIDSIAFIDTQGNRFKDRQALTVVQTQKNLYMEDNHEIGDSEEWIITSENRRDIVKMNLSTGEYETIQADSFTKTQPLKKWNYVWSNAGIYLLRYDGKESRAIVYADEYNIMNYHHVDIGLIYEYKGTNYIYNFETMENKKIYQKDFFIWDVFSLDDVLYIIGCEQETGNTKVIAYNINSEETEEVYHASQAINYKGFYNNNIYFDDKILNCLTGSVESTIELDYKVMEWKDKLYFTNHDGIIGKSENSLSEIILFNKNFNDEGYIWYFGDHLYLINHQQQLICRVDSDSLDVIDYVHMKTIEDYPKISQMFLINNEFIVQKDNEFYKFKQEELSSINLERINPDKDWLYSNETLFLNSRNTFENRGKYNEISRIIQEPYNEYAYTEDYIVYTDNKDRVCIIDRSTGNKNVVSDVTADRLELKSNHIFYQDRIKGIFKYNLINGETHKILEGCIFQYEIVEDKIYYIDNFLDRTLYVLDMSNNTTVQLSQDDVIVQDILVVNGELYYLQNDIAPILYKIENNQPEYVKLLDIACVDEIFPINGQEICFIHDMPDGFIMDTVTTNKGQIPNVPNDIIFENQDIIMFNTYLRCYEYGDIITGIYNKHTNTLENTHLSHSIDEVVLFNDWLYLIGTDYGDRFVGKINFNSYENEVVFQGVKAIISPDTKYLVGKEHGSQEYVFCNFETGEKKIMKVKVTELKYIKDGYIYYEYEGEDYRCDIGTLDKSEKIQ